jgi:hypothetical protein
VYKSERGEYWFTYLRTREMIELSLVRVWFCYGRQNKVEEKINLITELIMSVSIKKAVKRIGGKDKPPRCITGFGSL